MRKLFYLAGLAALNGRALAIYGIQTGPGSTDTMFPWIGQVGQDSGVLIDPHWVLTARHVGGTQFTLNGNTFTADQRIEHPTSDLALLHLSNTFGGFYPLYSGNVLHVTGGLVGYGESATPRGDNTGYLGAGSGSAGVRRRAANQMGLQQALDVDYGGSIGVLHVDFLLCDLDGNPSSPPPYNRDWFGDGLATPNEGGVLDHDSGGGFMLRDVNGNWRLAGIISILVTADDTPPNDPFPLAAFGHSGTGVVDLTNATNRDWVTSNVPEPGSLLAISTGIAALAGFQRRRRSRVEPARQSRQI